MAMDRFAISALAALVALLCFHPGSAASVKNAGNSMLRAKYRAQSIKKLPGYHSELLSRHFSGRITVNEATSRELFYWMVASEQDPVKDPLVIWLTGGPGCSSMDAFIYENGPFKFDFSYAADGTRDVVLTDNPHRWNKAATVVYVDSPSGTGMSISGDKEDYRTNDTHTVADLTNFVQQLLEVFPEYRDNDLYLAGESYAGVYVPLLARSLLKATIPGTNVAVNIKGYMVGNGVADDSYDSNHGVEFAHGHALISNQQLQDLETACNGNYWNATRGSKCYNLLKDMEDGWKDLNIYDIMEPCTLNGGRVDESSIVTTQLPGDFLGALRERVGRQWPLAGGVGDGQVLNWAHLGGHVIACADRRHALAWLNRHDVRAAIHAPSLQELDEWWPCTDKVHYRHDAGSMIPVHRHNLEHGLRVLIYSGDADYVVPFTGTRAWLDALGLKPLTPWHPWMHQKQVAGFSVRYELGLTFATVKGAGHMVPQTQPELALSIFRRFLSNEL